MICPNCGHVKPPPRLQEVADIIRAAGDWITPAQVLARMRNMWPSAGVGNVRVHVHRLRRDGAPIESDGRGTGSRGYRWQGA